MIDEASIKVVSGLRPKPRNPNRGTSDATPFQNKSSQNTSVTCANPMDRLCELLLDWRILEDIELGKRKPDLTDLVRLPNFYPTHQSYLASWEPLLIEEMKAGILSNLPLSTKRRSKCGTVLISTHESGSSRSTLINLNCAFVGNTKENVPSSSSEGSTR